MVTCTGGKGGKTLEVENGRSLSMEKCELARFNLHLRGVVWVPSAKIANAH